MRSCEVCSGLDRIGTVPEKRPKPRNRRVLIGERVVLLCDDHAAEVMAAGAENVSELRARFLEPGGQIGKSVV